MKLDQFMQDGYCALVTFYMLTGGKVSPQTIFDICKKHGWSQTYGLYQPQIPKIAKLLGLRIINRNKKLFDIIIKESKNNFPTITMIKKYFPKGVYIAGLRGHVTIIVDGQINDISEYVVKPRSRVINIWEVKCKE